MGVLCQSLHEFSIPRKGQLPRFFLAGFASVGGVGWERGGVSVRVGTVWGYSAYRFLNFPDQERDNSRDFFLAGFASVDGVGWERGGVSVGVDTVAMVL